MARKTRQRINYILPLANSPGGHRLGVNGLAVDSDRSILYSGGRDGTICAWDLNLDLAQKSPSASNPFASPEDSPPNVPSKTATASTFRSQVQAHTHWVNDIVLTQSNAALVSASSDITVKVWRPHAEDSQLPTTVGVHSDYVKCLASPGRHSDWLASGGLDHKIRVWDLAGGGEKLSIDAGEEEKSAKGSVYALSVRGSIMASGGPESIVRLWDPKSGKRITKFVGHTDNVRDILINEDGDTVMTASSDQTVKVWSVTAGRCMYTLTMHNDSVWSLYSDHPQLSVFYSSDRSGLVAKTDVRGSEDLDEGLSLAIAQEHGGVNKIVVAGDYFWTATSSSSINRWKNVDTNSEVERPESPSQLRNSSMTSRSNVPLPPPSSNKDSGNVETGKNIPFQCVLRISNAAPSPFSKAIDPSIDGRKASEVIMDLDNGVVVPLHSLPEDTIEGQNGLIKHVMLNNRKKVLTLDTAGEVTMWDLLKCVPIQSFGKRHLEDVVPEVNTMESVANWCSVDTRTGQLVVGLEENYCFDAEAYADELDSQELIDFREDQRINLGKWILRYLFANLIDEEIRRDDLHRSSLSTNDLRSKGVERENAPNLIQLPKSQPSSWPQNTDDSASAITPRPSNGNLRPAMTPGLAIGVATPSVSIPNHGVQQSNPLPTTTEEVNNIEKRQSNHSQARSSSERSGDYFSSNPLPSNEINGKIATPGGPQPEAPPQSPSDADKEEKPKESGSLFSKKFRMNFPKKLGRPSVDAKPPVVDEKAEESDKSSEKEDKVVEDNFYGVIQKMRNEYDEHLQSSTTQLSSTGIQPSLPNETPVLKPPPLTAVIIQEDRPDSGGVADLYRGTVSSVGQDADLIEKTAPMWLGDLLLRNQIPLKETVKVSFVLQPYEDILPSIASPDGNSRLNANRMLRAKKILSYVAERIEAQPEEPDPNALKPEDYLELYCQNQLVPHNMTLATLRAHVSKTGGDVMLYYKSNGKRPELEKKSLDGSAIESPTSNGVPITSS